MEDLITRFQHISEQIFEQLDNKSLTNCREVSKSCQSFIDDKNYSWIRIVNIPRILRVELPTYLHVAADKGQLHIFRGILEHEKNKNPGNRAGQTPFHLACMRGHFEIAKILVQNSDELSIILNAKVSHCFTE